MRSAARRRNIILKPVTMYHMHVPDAGMQGLFSGDSQVRSGLSIHVVSTTTGKRRGLGSSFDPLRLVNGEIALVLDSL